MSHLIWPWWQVTKTYIVLCINIATFHISVCLFQRLSLRRQILSTAGLPKPTTPWKTEECGKVLSEIYKKPQRKTPIFLLPSLRNLKKAYPVSILFYFHSPWIREFDTSRYWQQAQFYPLQMVVFLIRANGAWPSGIKIWIYMEWTLTK